MKESLSLGMNKTGVKTSPILTKEMMTGSDEFTIAALDTSIDAADLKQLYIKEADPVGSVPPPTTVRGVMKTGMQMLKGDNPLMLLDKLGERLAFERSGTRLYDALLTKCEVAQQDIQVPPNVMSRIHKIRAEEVQHYEMLRDVIESIGGDSTVMTPCADVSAVASMGIMQVVNDPRTTLAQTLEAILIAEMADSAGWDLLIQLVQNIEMSDLAIQFQAAKEAEELHFEFIRDWLQQLVLKGPAAVTH